jgi:hypothetical protein
MIIPSYWAEARLQRRVGTRQVTVRRFGYSNESQVAAEAHADARAQEALARIWAGEPLAKRELRRAYGGAEGLPIREEVVERPLEDLVITRNAYGARCLNVPDVLFVDVDFDTAPSGRAFGAATLTLGVAAFTLGMWLFPWCTAVAGALLAALLAGPLLALTDRVRVRMLGGDGPVALRRVRAFSRAHPSWQLRVYRTPLGLRVLAMHRTFDPLEKETSECFRALGADERYVRMCRAQRCFRARLSPKPWRLGEPSVATTSRAVWPIPAACMPAHLLWVDRYELASRAFAACAFLEALGSERTDERAERVRRIHDDACKAESGLPLA